MSTKAVESDFDWAIFAPPPPAPAPRPAAEPFDSGACLALLKQAGSVAAAWRGPLAGRAMTRPEAHFWLEAALTFITANSQRRWRDLPATLATLEAGSFTGEMDPDELKVRAEKSHDKHSPDAGCIALPLSDLLAPEQLAGLYASPWWLWRALARAFAERVLSHLTEAQRAHWRDLLRPNLAPAGWAGMRAAYAARADFLIAGQLGMAEELKAVVRSWPDGGHRAGACGSWLYPTVLFAAGDADFVAAEARRLKIALRGAGDVAGWLAVVRAAGLPAARDAVLRGRNNREATEAARVLARARLPQVAPLMLDLSLRSKARSTARHWLDAHPALAAAGLAAVAMSRDRLAPAALEWLRTAAGNGHAEAVRDALAAAEPAGAAAAAAVFGAASGAGGADGAGAAPVPVALDSTPEWLSAAIVAPGESPRGRRRRPPRPAPLLPAGLPPIVVRDRRLNDAQVAAVITVLRASPLDLPSPLLSALKRHATPESLEAFALRLFDDWFSHDAPMRHPWPLAALGHLGGDRAVSRLAPLLRRWPGDSTHKRGILAVQCLRAIGSPAALAALSEAVRHGRALTIPAKAGAALDAVAADRGLSREQLEDRIVPACGLEPPEVFDFGRRRFRLALGPNLRPAVVDESGRGRATLPRPSAAASDDPVKAAAASLRWKEARERLCETLARQSARLERAMLDRRRWTAEEFDALLARHPLTGRLVPLLVWGDYDASGALRCTFRVTEDGSRCDGADAPAPPAGSLVGLPHPVDLDERQRRAWVELFMDYEIIPPFAQMARPVYPPDPSELSATEVARLKGVSFPSALLTDAVTDAGWHRVYAGRDPGVFPALRRAMAGVTVAVDVHNPGARRPLATPCTVEGCYFLAGDGKGKERLPLGAVPPAVVSEVVRFFLELSAAGGGA